MKARLAAAAVGVAAVWAVLSLLGLAPAVAVDPARPASTTVVAEFPRAIGLYAGDEVRVLGTTAGTIRKVEPLADRVKVTMKVEDVALAPDAIAVLRLHSLIGERYVELAPVWEGEGPRLEDGAVIPQDRTSVPAEISDVMRSLTDLTGELNGESIGRLVDTFAVALDGRHDTVAQVTADVAEIGRTLEARTAELDAGLVALTGVVETLAARDQSLAQIVRGGAAVGDALLAQDGALDRAIVAVDGLAGELVHLTDTQREDLVALFDRLDRVGAVLAAHRDGFGTVVENLPWFSYGYERAIQNDGERWYVVNNPMGLLFVPTGPALNSRGGPGLQPEDGTVLPRVDSTGSPADEAIPEEVDVTEYTGPGPLLPAATVGTVRVE